ncbi:MAG: hypothetical protein ABW202_20165 [Duganella sp.]
MQYFDLPDLLQLYRSGGVRALSVAEVGEKYQIHITTAQGSGTLRDGCYEGSIEFATSEHAAAYLLEQGLQDASQPSFQEHDNWVRRKVQASLDGLRSGRNAVYSEEEWADIQRARKAKLGV